MITSTTDLNAEKVAGMEKNDHQFILWLTTEGMNMKRETVLTEELNMKKVCGKMLLKISALGKDLRKIFL
jgi:hypothetical protein